MHISTLDWNIHSHIGLDLDETLASTMSGVLREAHSQGKLSHIRTFEDIKVYNIHELDPAISVEENFSLWEAYGRKTLHPESVAQVAGSREGVHLLLERGKLLSIVTARSDNPEWKKTRTMHWIDYHFPEITNIHFVNHFTKDALPKSRVCKEYNVTLMIDDSIENAKELAENGIATIVLEKPWNKDIRYTHPLIYRVANWQEIIISLTQKSGKFS